MGEAISKHLIEVGKITENMMDKVNKSIETDMYCSCCGKQFKVVGERCHCLHPAGIWHCTGCCDTPKMNALAVAADLKAIPFKSVFQRELCSFYDFKDVREIGAGAFGTVYYGKEPPSNRDVALKRIKLTNIDTDVVKEVNILKSFRHPNIVKCFYSFEEMSRGVKYHVLVLEYVNGGDLETWLKRKTNDHQLLVPEADIWRVFTQIADAVRYIHARRIIHRDLKPSNVLLTKKYIVKLADFGISRQQNAESFAHTVCGTPYYMSPECILEQPYTTKTDIWSLGCILYEMATLRSPFYGHKGSLMQKIRDAEYPPFPARCCYTEQLKLLVQRCLQPEYNARPSAVDVYQMAAGH